MPYWLFNCCMRYIVQVTKSQIYFGVIYFESKCKVAIYIFPKKDEMTIIIVNW